MQGRNDRIGRPPAIGMARSATAAEARLIRSELAGLFGGTLRLRKVPAKKSKRPSGSPAPSADRCKRALAAAVAAFGAQDGRAFLNGHHRGLNGPPVELAAASSAGLRVVEAAIAIEARRRAEGDAR
ncbi:hypothetical protein [Sphingosinicella terrae]|uniref:hypothetical protein n=1 Tax=Sphingosinicella terrae TaxID=2172047 RepID=UPI000E0D6C15|nr:hypothetical protein [Sphingosinicella terrae]